MNISCGIDIVYIPNIKRIQQSEKSLSKFFNQSEITNSSIEHIAGIIAAKEAFFKCLGKVPKFLEIEIRYEKSGKPFIFSSIHKDEYDSVDISISHDGSYVVAAVVMLKK